MMTADDVKRGTKWKFVIITFVKLNSQTITNYQCIIIKLCNFYSVPTSTHIHPSAFLTVIWSQVTFLYSNDPRWGFGKMGETLMSVLQSSGIKVTQHGVWDVVYLYNYRENPFLDLVKRTYKKTRSKY